MQRHPRTRLRVHRACTNADPKVGAKSEESSAFPVRRRNIIKTLSMTGTARFGRTRSAGMRIPRDTRGKV